MKLPRACMVVATLIAGLAGTAHAAEALDSYLEGVRARYGLPALAAAVARNGEIVAAGAAGTRVMGMDIPVTVDDRFHLGSDTKAMTATIAGMPVEDGRITWKTTLAGDARRNYKYALPSRSGPFETASALRLSVRTPPFHDGARGSIPLGRATLHRYCLG